MTNTGTDHSFQSVNELIDQIEQLHSAPPVARKILEITRDIDFEIDDVILCLEHDPALAAAILRLVNSSHFGLANKLSNIQQAIAYLGRRSLRLTVLGFGLIDGLMRSAPAILFEDYWRRSLTMAVAARILASGRELDGESAFSAGLFADLGVLLFAQVDPDIYPQACANADHNGKLVRIERELYGFDHTVVGAALLARWQFPSELTRAVANHHHVSLHGPMIDRIIHTASILAEVLWTPDSNRMGALQTILLDHFDRDTDGLILLAEQCKSAIVDSMEMFRVELSGEIDPSKLRHEAHRQFQRAALDASLELDSIESIVDVHGP